MIIICCGMKRSGSTVQYQIAKEIIERNKLGKGLGFVVADDFSRISEKYKNGPEMVVIKTHDFLEDKLQTLERDQYKAVYIYRDLRDVTVSIMAKGNRVFSRFMLSGALDQILEADAKWRTVDNLLISCYEFMIDNLAQEVRRIAEFLEIQLQEEEINLLAEQLSLGNQVKRIKAVPNDEKEIKKGKQKQIYVDQKSLLHENHIHSGAYGQWKTSLTPVQIGIVESYVYSWLLLQDYHISQKWVNRRIAGFVEIIKPIIPLIRKVYFTLGLR